MVTALPSSSSHTFPPQHPSTSSTASSAPRNSRTILSDTTSQCFGNPNSLSGPPPSHFFPSVPKAQREKARQARLDAAAAAAAAAGSPSPPPPAVPAKDSAGLVAGGGEAGTGSSDDERQQRQARAELASSGPFDNRRPSAVSLSAGSGVGAGGSTGTKRRRDVDRTSWDAASELVRIEREKDKMFQGSLGGGKGSEGVRDEEDREKTPTPSMARSLSMANGSHPRETASTSASPDPPEPAKRLSIASLVSDDADEDAMALDDDASVVTAATGMSGGAASDGSAKEPAKKRSRTLTTPAQTAVLNALLAKTRFPSTEVREEVGRQIGMSARRVQVWFQNRRQSQKRQRDREAQESAAASAAAASAMSAGGHPSMHHHPGYPTLHPHAYPLAAYGQPVYPGMQAGKPLPPHPGAVYTGRPDLNRDASMDSLSSQQSYASSRLSMGSSYQAPSAMHSRDSLAPLPSEQRFLHPYAGGAPAYTFGRPPHPGYAPGGLPVPPPQHTYSPHPGAPRSIPAKLYFPHVPRSHAPPGRIQAEPLASTAEVKLPSLSAVLGAGPAAPQPAQQPPPTLPLASAPVDHQPMFSHSPFSPTPAYASVTSPGSAPLPNPSYQRAMFSPEPSSSFERLRISGGPLSPTSATAPSPFSPLSTAPTPSTAATTPAPARPGSTDILDVAMETMAYRSSGRSLPPRQTLPPLRSVFGDAPVAARGGKKGGPSEADKALLAPIKTESAGSSTAASGPLRLPPIQTFAAVGLPTASSSSSSSASPPTTTSRPAPRDSRASTWSEASHATRSSGASFEFGKPPAGSYRASTSSERDVLAEERGERDARRGESVETEETSASAAEVGVAK